MIARIQAGEIGPTSGDDFWSDAQEPNESNIYEGTCPVGHPTRSVLQNPKFEILFDAAALALIDGYHREAISTFGTALERAFEFFARVTATHLGISWERFDGAWKFVDRQSERQFGAFVFCHLALTGEPPPFTKSKHEAMMRLRNDVVHSGTLVDREQAQGFGAYVYDVINQLIAAMHDKAGDARGKEISRIIQASRDPSAEMTSTMVQMTLVSLIRGGAPPPLERALAHFEQHNCWVAWDERVTLADLAKHSGKRPHDLLELLEAALTQVGDTSEQSAEIRRADDTEQDD